MPTRRASFEKLYIDEDGRLPEPSSQGLSQHCGDLGRKRPWSGGTDQGLENLEYMAQTRGFEPPDVKGYQ